MSQKIRQPGAVARIRNLVSSSRSYSSLVKIVAEELFVRAYTNSFSRGILRRFVCKENPARWIFVIGCYNSGTTLLQKILGAHPDISALPREGVRFTNRLSDLELNSHHMMWDDDYKSYAIPDGNPRLAYEGIVADWRIFWKNATTYLLDKSIANTARMLWLDNNFPNACFVGIHRNGYCIAEGLNRRARPPEWLQQETGTEAYPLSMTARQWVIANQELVDGMAQVERGNLIRFESFVETPYQHLFELLSDLGLSTDCLVPTPNGISLGGKSFEIRNPNSASLARLSDDEFSEITPVLAPMMERLKYPLHNGGRNE